MARPPKKHLKALYYDLPKAHDPLHGSDEPPMVINYSFAPKDIRSLDLPYSGWKSFSGAQKAAVRDALAEFQTFINVRFVEGGGGIDLYLGRANISSDGFGGIQWSAGPNFFRLDGYAIFDRPRSLTDAYGDHLLRHEIGHAMTLKHPGDYGGREDGPFLPGKFENNKFSVMSYIENPDSGELSGRLMLYDVAALQARFGANTSHHAGNDVYGVPESRVEVLWDADGEDRIDARDVGKGVTIDLRDGRFSSLGAENNLAIAFGAVIENATGGRKGDKLFGNKAANELKGGRGGDVLDGGRGKDFLSGGPGADVFRFTAPAASGRDTVADFDPGRDLFRLDNNAFAGLGGKGALATKKFWIGDAAHDGNDRIVYDDDSGRLIHDANGDRPGEARVFARLDPGLDLEAGLFIVI